MFGRHYETDHVDSDDMDEILELSRSEYSSLQSQSSQNPGPSRITDSVPHHRTQQALNEQISQIDAEICGFDQDIKELNALRALRVAERDALSEELRLIQNRGHEGKGKRKMPQGGIDYFLEDFDWSEELKVRMKKVFGINSFRLCQQGVCNANMDARDIICVMPTGGGKSLTYQLPALMTPGCTLVISPLISLITDQVLHLKDAGVEAVMLTGGTPNEDVRDIMARLDSLATRKGRNGADPKRDITLCYVTPEKVAKSKQFMCLLEKLVSAGRLARIVIDEAHCVSQLGHDFRPDYGKLSKLRQLFPSVPIMCLSATCPPKVLEDLVTNLKLKAIVDGSCANTEGTVYFSAPLYRKNLHYMVLPKHHHSASKVIEHITEYILEHHPNDSGIVYCASKKDAENVASGLSTESNGKIKTGVYHSDVSDKRKEELHLQWRKGAVKVVCATIAFGLGIDKGDVRFVLHHSISKSMDGFYQESGRAGRDGKDADCILYYRPQDATRMSAMVCEERDGREKLHDVLRFAQDMKECRKVQFAKYFSASSHLSLNVWTTDDSTALEPCGHCDNCTRLPGHVDHQDVTLEAWQILKVSDQIRRSGGRATVNMLVDLVRGLGHGSIDVSGGKTGEKDKFHVDIDDIAGGKIGLNKDRTETLLIQLLVDEYLTESYHQNSYTVNVYIIPGPQALRLIRLTREDVTNGKAPKVTCSFRNLKAKKKLSIRKSLPKNSSTNKQTTLNGKASRKATIGEFAENQAKEDSDEIEFEDEERHPGFFVRHPESSSSYKKRARGEESIDSDDDDRGWTYSMLPVPETRKKLRKHMGGATLGNGVEKEGDIEVMILSD